jgi:hypothetical protein
MCVEYVFGRLGMKILRDSYKPLLGSLEIEPDKVL